MTQVQPEEDISHDVTANKNWQRIDNPSDKRRSGVVLVVVWTCSESEPGPALSAAFQQKLFICQSTYWTNDLVAVQPHRTLLVFQEKFWQQNARRDNSMFGMSSEVIMYIFTARSLCNAWRGSFK